MTNFPHQFRAGYLSAEDAAALTRMSRAMSGQGTMQVRPPLSIIRQGWDGQPIIYLDTSGLGDPLATANSDGTESGTSTDLRFDQDTGVHKTADDPSAGIDTVSLLAATTIQMGAVTVTSQDWAGSKNIVTAGSESHFSVSRDRSSSPFYNDEIEISNFGSGSNNLQVRADRVAFYNASGPVLWGGTVSLVFQPLDGTGYMVLGLAAGGNPLALTAPYASVDAVSAVRIGITRNFASGEYPIVVGGIVVGVWSGSGSIPPVPPTPTPSPIPLDPPPGDTGTIAGSAYFTTFLPVTGRTVTLTGATSDSTTTDSSGGYSFSGVNVGSNTVTLSASGGETCTTSVDGGSGSSGFAGTVTMGSGETRSVGFIVNP